MSPRRVIRNRPDMLVPEIARINPPTLDATSFWGSIFIVGAILWRCIKILWYWIERIIMVFLLLGLTVGLAWWLSQKPSNYRDWSPSESLLQEVSFSGNIAIIKNFRNHLWSTENDFVPQYSDARYNLDEIESVHYIIVPFSDRDGPAHTMLSFTFSGGQHVVISAEVRKEQGESFSALNGILNQFEMMYVIGSENDLIKLRTHYRKNEVYMYPINTPKEKISALFRTMLIRADKLSREPEFYNTLWNNCTTSILLHANSFREEKIPWTIKTLLPSHSDSIVFNAGLIDTDLSLGEARSYYRVDEQARTVVSTGSTFSEIVRKARK